MGLNPAKVWIAKDHSFKGQFPGYDDYRASVMAGSMHPPRLQRAFDQQEAPRIFPGPDEPPAGIRLLDGDASTSTVHLAGRERSFRNTLDTFLYMPRCLAVFVNQTDGLSRHDNLQHHGHNMANDLQLL
ncbi:hypothetical protein NCU17066 [Neurospora crassa OR74A]|uniref:Uncharacterized protein n=1 Tax=Neurospora crassa (strain ATCC 24698 / 74-OR23-1A / CBS 708.71 / DSM 1257 / FGSC 987) TaxID=367110 RepID=V5IKL3_NEUCR|nr:hypothetical protein NCU17066 [Neurospora crassa OR74A]ESA42118.1 hypothetical protein NCU17066 [Neurospora crassa OR74A]|eukprot:XP_011395078.1 hypothetical protein NCU17066 [Neurospora crassa OR74A]